MDKKEMLIERLIDEAIELTIMNDINTEKDIRSFIQGKIDYEYKTYKNVSPEQRKKFAKALSDVVIKRRFGEKKTMNIYIARDRAVFEDEAQENHVSRHPEHEIQYGRLRLFYERPTFNQKTGIWEQARGAAEIKSYMFPQIRCEECAEFEGPGDIPEYPHYPGMFHTLQDKP